MSVGICKKRGKHVWLWPWQQTKRCAVCGAFKNLKVGENTITWSPDLTPVTDILRWSSSNGTSQAGDLGMTTGSGNGRPRAYIHTLDRDLVHIDETMVQIRTALVGVPTQIINFTGINGDEDIAYCLTGYFEGDNAGVPHWIELDINSNPGTVNEQYRIEKTRYELPGGPISEDHTSGTTAHPIMWIRNGDGEIHEGWFQTWIWALKSYDWIFANTLSGHTENFGGDDFVVTSHSFLRLEADQITSIQVDGNIGAFFEPGSRFTLTWWPMKDLP